MTNNPEAPEKHSGEHDEKHDGEQSYFPQLALKLPLECPACRAPLHRPPPTSPHRDAPAPQPFDCPKCATSFSLWQDIPDLRLEASTYDSREKEEETFWKLLDWSRTYETVGLVHTFIHETTKLPVEIKELYIENRLCSVQRGHDVLELFDWLSRRAGFGCPGFEGSDNGDALGDLLDVGTGTGGQLVAAESRAGRLIGLDASTIELAIARRLFFDRGLTDRVQLFSANAEHLPFAGESIDTILMRDVVEHLTDQQAGLQEIWRTLKPGGRFYFNSPNRYAAWWPEPHTQLYLLGFMPRRWMSPYTQWRISMPYSSTRLLGLIELKRMLNNLTPRPKKMLIVATPPPGANVVPNLGPLAKLPLLQRALLSRKFNNLPLIRPFTPEHQILLIK